MVHASLQVQAGGEEGGAVGILQLNPAVMVEVRLQIRVTERHGQRVGVVRDRHQLAGGRLTAPTVVVDADVCVVVEVVEQHRARCPVQDLVVVDLAVGLVVLVLRIRGDTQLGADVTFLVHEREAGALVDVAV